MILEHGTRPSCVQQLTLLPLLQVKADHLVLDTRTKLEGNVPVTTDNITWIPPISNCVGLWGYRSMHCISIMWAEWWVNMGIPRLI